MKYKHLEIHKVYYFNTNVEKPSNHTDKDIGYFSDLVISSPFDICHISHKIRLIFMSSWINRHLYLSKYIRKLVNG